MSRPVGSKNKATLEKIAVGLKSEVIPATAVPETTETEEEILERISKTFRVLEKVVQGVIEKKIRSAIVAGATGTGKTFTIQNALEIASMTGTDFELVKGAMSAIGLYKTLYENRNPHQVLVIDDCDSIFWDQEALNVLKSALDTTKKRVLSWNKESWALRTGDEDPVPQEFEYFGAVIFITNLDLALQVARETKISPHIDALIGRSIYIDLGIHSKREIMCRVKMVMESAGFLGYHDLTDNQGKIMLDWLATNLQKLRNISIRTALQLGSMLRTDPKEWEEVAEVVLFKRGKY